MDRFVAMIWDQDDQSRLGQVDAWSQVLQRQSPRWVKVLDAKGLRVFSYCHRSDVPIMTKWQELDGAVIGVLFERGQEKKGRVRTLDRSEADRIVSSRGDSLTKNYWGNYVAFWRNDSGEATVLRDPCGAVPCLMTRQSGINLFFAYVEDVTGFHGLNFTTDWNFAQSFLLFDYFITEHTGLNEVKEVRGGERVEFGADGKRTFSWAWNAADIAAEPKRVTFAEARAELRSIGEACFTAWGKEYGNVVVRLSGGLDSSIVLALLRRVSDARITALHFLGAGYEKYEDSLARLAANHADVELIEIPLDAAATDLRAMLDSPRLARPIMQMMAVEAEKLAGAVDERVGADCFMTGNGGDILFLQRSGAKHTLADYVRLNGFGRDFWRIAYGAAMLRRISIWKELGNVVDTLALQREWRPFTFLEDKEKNRHRPLTPLAIETIPDEYVSHPWLRRAEGLPHGAADQVQGLLTLHNFYSRRGSALVRDGLNPLFCQPIAEFSLRTPTYLLAYDGLDRAIERQAFEDLIPRTIVERTGKGGINHYQLQIMLRNLDFIRSIILDGDFMAHGWLDRSKTERMLRAEYVAHGEGAGFIYRLVVCEVWLKSWRGTDVRIAA